MGGLDPRVDLRGVTEAEVSIPQLSSLVCKVSIVVSAAVLRSGDAESSGQGAKSRSETVDSQPSGYRMC